MTNCQYCQKQLTSEKGIVYCSDRCQRKAALRSVEAIMKMDRAEKLDKLLEATL